MKSENNDQIWTVEMLFPERYHIRDREAGNTLDAAESLEDARSILREFERTDLEDGVYTPDFYEIYDSQTEEVVE